MLGLTCPLQDRKKDWGSLDQTVSDDLTRLADAGLMLVECCLEVLSGDWDAEVEEEEAVEEEEVCPVYGEMEDPMGASILLS